MISISAKIDELLANLEYDLPVTNQTVFHATSISKQFTAYAVHILEKQEKLFLKDDIRRYLNFLPDFIL